MDRGNPPFCWMRRPRRPRRTFARCSVVLLNIDGYSRAFAGHSAPLCTTTGPRKHASKHTHTQFDRSMVAANPHNPLYGRRRRETEEQKSQQQDTVYSGRRPPSNTRGLPIISIQLFVHANRNHWGCEPTTSFWPDGVPILCNQSQSLTVRSNQRTIERVGCVCPCMCVSTNYS